MSTVGLLRTLFNPKILPSNVTQLQSLNRSPFLLGFLFNHEQVRNMSRVKRRNTHPGYWLPLKNVQKKDDKISADNLRFVREVIQDKYKNKSPLKGSELQIEKTEWDPKTKRSGVIARNIGRQQMWDKAGNKIVCTVLHVLDNHVIRYIPPEEYVKTSRGAIHFKNKTPLGCLVVGAEATNPEKFTRQYCNLFSEVGLLPKKTLSRFIITPNAALPPCTPITAGHFLVGQAVDVYGKTIDHGFQGVVKRWGFKGGPASHGATKFHRRGGTIGTGRDKARVWPGTKMPGHMGSERRYNRGLMIMRINMKYNVIYVKGTVPGATNSIVRIFDTLLPLRKLKEAPPHPTYFPPEDGTQKEEDIWDSSLHVYGSPSISV
ncbi:39S ribosomal protein L3, mitochondrial-like [Daphnia pulex]|uniref:39S ribosomal protein L3, mitochondrial-like n=1 Tax=Daphnia pulex TaxID=6669 RepID=UPI001EDCC427|nr:39S ribosomal protein L3, mitochondrial-like [Daphnia pulex]